MKTGMTIGNIAEELNLSADTLRFYEKTGVTGTIARDSGGRRVYSEEDKRWLEFVSCLKSTGMPLDKIRLYLNLMSSGDDTAMDRREIIVEHQKKLIQMMTDLQQALDRINYKVEFYDDLIKSHGIETSQH